MMMMMDRVLIMQANTQNSHDTIPSFCSSLINASQNLPQSYLSNLLPMPTSTQNQPYLSNRTPQPSRGQANLTFASLATGSLQRSPSQMLVVASRPASLERAALGLTFRRHFTFLSRHARNAQLRGAIELLSGWRGQAARGWRLEHVAAALSRERTCTVSARSRFGAAMGRFLRWPNLGPERGCIGRVGWGVGRAGAEVCCSGLTITMGSDRGHTTAAGVSGVG